MTTNEPPQDGEWGERKGTENSSDALQAHPPKAFEGDKWFYRAIAWFLGLTVVISAGGAIYLAHFDKKVPPILVALGSASIGAFAGVLVDTKRH